MIILDSTLHNQDVKTFKILANKHSDYSDPSWKLPLLRFYFQTTISRFCSLPFKKNTKAWLCCVKQQRMFYTAASWLCRAVVITKHKLTCLPCLTNNGILSTSKRTATVFFEKNSWSWRTLWMSLQYQYGINSPTTHWCAHMQNLTYNHIP